MAKLNPPIIENSLDAQYGTELRIPYEQNKSVGVGEFSKIKALIKSVQSNKQIENIDSVSLSQGIARFEIDKSNYKVGQYYKIQLAYVGEDDSIGFYSTTGVFKYTAKPVVSIKGLEGATALNLHDYTYTGLYHCDDRAEKVYSYRFKIYDLSSSVLVDSGELLHNSSNDTEAYDSEDTWTVRYSLDYDEVCYIQYIVTTINGITVESEKYRITDNQVLDSNLLKYYYFDAENVADSACVSLSIKPNSSALASGCKLINGQFNLLRASNEDDYKSWYKLTSFALASWDSSQSKFLCNDYSVAQGITYKYALQAYNNKGVFSKRIEASPLTVDFEDIFLNDGERQLRVRFNPKVSSFKNTILEQKTDTIGSKYPFFFRNGNVKYKEFPISGLISILADENAEFINGMSITEKKRALTPAIDLAAIDYQLTDPVGENFKREREFKEEVLEWLTNGKPKLFRSAAEGSYIVRLMNTSLSPNDTLGRMLHTFSSTAYEVADYTFDNLREYGMLMDEAIETRDLAFKQIKLKYQNKAIALPNAVLATISNGMPNTRFKFKLLNNDNPVDCYLGSTGGYDFGGKEALSTNPLTSITLISDSWDDAILTYAYYVDKEYSALSTIEKINIDDRVEQWIGMDKDKFDELIDEQKVLYSVGRIYYLKVTEKSENYIGEVTTLPTYNIGNGCWQYIDLSGTTKKVSSDTILSYQTVASGPKYYCVYRQSEATTQVPDKTLKISYSNGKTDIVDMAGQELSVVTDGRVILTDLTNVTGIYLGKGVYADIVYQYLTKQYTVETTNTNLAQKKATWIASGKQSDFEIYYESLINALKINEGSLIVDAL